MYKRFTALDVVSKTEAIPLTKLFGSPLYVYKESIIRQKIQMLIAAAKEFKVCYAIKANTNTHIVKLIRDCGIKHIDVVSPGEIYKALSCGYTPS
jgi:diaminopimelate decarboxylase